MLQKDLLRTHWEGFHDTRMMKIWKNIAEDGGRGRS